MRIKDVVERCVMPEVSAWWLLVMLGIGCMSGVVVACLGAIGQKCDSNRCVLEA
jgi:hypothetical protein